MHVHSNRLHFYRFEVLLRPAGHFQPADSAKQKAHSSREMGSIPEHEQDAVWEILELEFGLLGVCKRKPAEQPK
ncbi:hypothetical protein [Acidaminococcus sp. AM05-11]|uniref:hypothetical protein n=1 Tax=Acidaminococcus sp. AM05-11 TaxID=2291997 RepID=UPI001F492DEC|nr:hypothetical protein [Acidaminococcus sp. AM05-11]